MNCHKGLGLASYLFRLLTGQRTLSRLRNTKAEPAPSDQQSNLSGDVFNTLVNGAISCQNLSQSEQSAAAGQNARNSLRVNLVLTSPENASHTPGVDDEINEHCEASRRGPA